MEALSRAWDGTPREQALAWVLLKGGRTACCALRSHPFGWELRATVDDELVKSQAYRDEAEVLRNLSDWPI
jgi:hypothetical protein